LRRSDGPQHASQIDLRMAVATTSTTSTTTIAVEYVNRWTTIIVTTPTPQLLNPGDEYETAQMEEAARAHLAAANDLLSATAALNASATAIGDVDIKLETDPALVRRKKRVTKIKAAIRTWAERRWASLKRLSTGERAIDEETSVPPEETPAPPPPAPLGPSSTIWPRIVVPRDVGRPAPPPWADQHRLALGSFGKTPAPPLALTYL